MEAVNINAVEAVIAPNQETAELIEIPDFVSVSPTPSPSASKQAIRTSLKASTIDGVFATIFSNVAGGVLLSNFLVELGATPTQVGMLSSIPMLANLLQPLGAILSDRMTSRHFYCLWVYGPSRLLWLILVAGIAFASWGEVDSQTLVQWTLAIVFITHFSGAFGSAAWLSWMAALVPRRLRGRYFGLRSSAASLTNLISVPLLGLIVSHWAGGSIQGFGVVLLLAIVIGMISLGCQFFMVDVNPQLQQAESEPTQATSAKEPIQLEPSAAHLSYFSFLKDKNFLLFLLYFGLWMFAVNLSNPFFNLYLLDDLAIDVSWVTIYNSLGAAASLVMLIVWGKLADRIGNRPILLTVGILVAVVPLFWLGTSNDSLSLWLWFPLLHILGAATGAAIDLCTNNLQLGVAPIKMQATYFAIAAAIAGVSGALGTTTGGLLAEFANLGGIPSLFALSGIVRLMALLPLIFVHEQPRQSLQQMMQTLFPRRTSVVAIEVPIEDLTQ